MFKRIVERTQVRKPNVTRIELSGTYDREEDTAKQRAVEEANDWFAERGITPEVLAHNDIFMEHVHCPSRNEKVYAIAFPYKKADQIVNIKYRLLPKTFWQVGG